MKLTTFVLLNLFISSAIATSPANAEEHWGALACGLWRNANGVAQVAVGSAIDHKSESEAVERAIAQCRKAGGRDCQIEGNGAFNRGCGFIAAARDNSGMVWCTSRPTAEEILAHCKANGRNCETPIGGCVGQ